jgi:hypothetical protein
MAEKEYVEIVGSNGRPRFGIYRKPLESFDLGKLRRYGKRAQGPVSAFRLKRWQYLGVCNESVIFGLAVVDAGYLGNMFTYAFNRETKELLEFDIIHPLGLATEIKGNSLSGDVSFKNGKTVVYMKNEADSISLTSTVKGRLKAELRFERYPEAMNIITRVGLKGFNYTTKESGMAVSGTIQVGDRGFAIEPSQSSGVLDYTFGCLSHYTFWNWASGGGFDSEGRRIGFNLVQGVNETGYTENAFWIDGQMIKTDTIDFQYNDLNILEPWRLVSNDGKLDLTFYPEGERKKTFNLGILMSNFHQPFGRFEGTLRDGETVYQIKSAFGFTEEHEAKW